MTREAPTGDVTLVFTDVQGSTHLWEHHTAAMEQALELHNALFRRLIAEHGGYEVKTEGDAFMIAFSTPANALACASAVQTALIDAAWPETLLAQPDACVESDDRGLVFR